MSGSWFVAECKYRTSLPAWLLAAVAQARRNAGALQLPVVVLAVHGQRLDDALVVIRFSDFREHYGAVADVLASADYAELEVLAPDLAGVTS